MRVVSWIIFSWNSKRKLGIQIIEAFLTWKFYWKNYSEVSVREHLSSTLRILQWCPGFIDRACFTIISRPIASCAYRGPGRQRGNSQKWKEMIVDGRVDEWIDTNERVPLSSSVRLSIFRCVSPFLAVGYSSRSSRIIHLAFSSGFQRILQTSPFHPFSGSVEKTTCSATF